ncbi:Myosin light chain kinase 2, skeletal/cardiac muscle [Aptenodytes forsteri]|uniref:Myosin light chain kinase 2, skeletal/cardiac muscle n=1 Tax=Aptenodytes forsteri TaxID=9233 RepID=A0A087R8Q7_APTFO|nr:Myosin light chain kinase 2, skeletal/cardiac muscle [Aptenodytes forsteri]
MEQGSRAGSTPGAGGAGGTATPKADGSTTQPVPEALQAARPQGRKAAPTEGTVPAATGAQDEGKDEPGQEKALAAAAAQDGGQAEPGKEKAAGEARGAKAEPAGATAPTAPEPGDGRKAAPAEEASAAQHNGGQAASSEEKVLAAAKAQDGGKDEPGKEKAPAAGEPEGGQAARKEGKGPAVVEAQDGGKDKPKKGQASGGLEAECGGKAEPTEEKAPAAAESEGGKAKPAEETALAAAQARGGGKEEPAKEKTTTAAKEKVPAAAKAQDGGKKAAKAEKTLADKKPVKEKAPAAVQDGGKKAANAEKTPAAKKPQDGSKEPAKEKAPTAAKMQDGGKKAAKVEPPPAAAEAGHGGKEPAEVVAAPAAKAQGEGEKAATAKEADKQQQPRGPKLRRPALLQSLSCPAACQREEQPWVEAAVMEMIPEEVMVAELREGPAEPRPAPRALGDLQPPEPPIPTGSPGTPRERTLPSATGQPTDPTGATEQPGPGGQPSSTEAEPPPSPYLTPDFGKEDPFEILDDVPPPPAPFAHRIVTLRSASVSSQFSLSSKEILGGGKFGEVHTCTEKQTGLKLAAKVIRKQGAKDKEMVLLEIDVMNQLNHRNLVQLYDAIETPREIILFMEFVEGGELFERIVDDDYHLTEVDCMVFVRQICEGIRFMHHMRVLHLDLKPENILCVAATGHMVKIIDFGLARRCCLPPSTPSLLPVPLPPFDPARPRGAGSPGTHSGLWLWPWLWPQLSLAGTGGLSGLSPFLGDNDTETLNNVLAANWYFDEETFESVSDEAKDFVSNLIIKQKSARMSAGQCLQHPWLNNLAEKAKRCNRRLKSQVLLKKYVMRRRWKKNFIGVCAANRFKKITSSGSLTALDV